MIVFSSTDVFSIKSEWCDLLSFPSFLFCCLKHGVVLLFHYVHICLGLFILIFESYKKTADSNTWLTKKTGSLWHRCSSSIGELMRSWVINPPCKWRTEALVKLSVGSEYLSSYCDPQLQSRKWEQWMLLFHRGLLGNGSWFTHWWKHIL